MHRESQISIRVPKELRQAFIDTAKREDRTASQLVRDWIREYVRAHGQQQLHLEQKK